MANLTVRRSEAAPSTIRAGMDPMKLMREMLGWDPFSEMAPLFGAEEQVVFNPAFEVKETKEGFVFRADVPGVKDSDIELRTSGNRLTISGKREYEQKEKGETWYSSERGYGSFTRVFTLPEGADAEHAKAELSSGVLTIQIPKRPEVQSRRIQISPEKKH